MPRTPPSLMDDVAAIVAEVGETVVRPRFLALAPDEVSEKTPGDPLTVADLEAERALGARLPGLLPGSLVVGEEAVSDDPDLLRRLDGEAPVWLVDPIDGTLNFSKGLALFCVMVALIRGGETVAGWIYDPMLRRMAMAEAGGGAMFDGGPVRLAPPADIRRFAGALHIRPGNREQAATVARNLPKVGPLLVLHCAGMEYQAMLMNRLHIATFHQPNPWDQAPGLLIQREAGGHSALIDGTPYDLRNPRRPLPLLIAPSEAAWYAVREALFEIPA